LVKHVKDLQRSFGGTWKDLAEFALKVAGHPAPVVTINWTDPQSVDDMQAWSMMILKLQAGVPFKTVMVEAGYQPEVVDTWTEPAPPPMTGTVSIKPNQPGQSGVPLSNGQGQNLPGINQMINRMQDPNAPQQ
jgi:hypothetical protein